MLFLSFFIFGSFLGSFSNVCIRRLPKNESIVFNRSYCPGCKKVINWYDNIPIISFIMLKAKCRNCDFKISLEYFIVEISTAIIFSYIYYLYGFSITFLLLMVLSVFFIIIFKVLRQIIESKNYIQIGDFFYILYNHHLTPTYYQNSFPTSVFH